MAGLGIQSILVMDESRYYARMLHSLLLAFEVPIVQSYYSMDDAMEALKHTPFDLIIVDWPKKEGDPLSFVANIRKGIGVCEQNMPIILCTAHTSRSKVTFARDSGVTEILLKPISPEQLMSKMVNACFKNRLFVESKTYKGPCRRRKDKDFVGSDKRNKSFLDQEQVDTVMKGSGEDATF